MIDRIAEQGFEVRRLPGDSRQAQEQDALETLAVLDGRAVDWLIVDHYGLDAEWETAVRSGARRLMAIDDLADRPHMCDLLLDQNFFPDADTRYQGLVPDPCQILTGPKYALLREEFSRLRPPARPAAETGLRAMVFFGKADFANLTGRALEALAAQGDRLARIEVVLGEGHPHEAAIATQAEHLPQAVVHRFVADMAALMAEADLFVGAGGSTNWERFYMGVPTIALALAPNQTLVAEPLAESGCLIYLGEAAALGPQSLQAAIATVIENPHLRTALARNGRALVDGRGTERVASVLLTADVTLRSATAEDAERVFAWRNSDEVRRRSFDPSPVAWETHSGWFHQTLAREDRALLIGEWRGQPIGVVRYDMEGDRARISVYLAPGQTQPGLGRRLIGEGSAWLKAHRPGVHTVIAEVMADNEASRRAFLAAGYEPDHQVLKQTL
jgi:UDP-2,4-diacetamido-2,4,6-trideoxy-beta-L-altropyranose hydrolase